MSHDVSGCQGERKTLLDNLSTDLLRLGSSKLLSVLSDVRVKDPTMPYNPLPTLRCRLCSAPLATASWKVRSEVQCNRLEELI